MSQAQILDDVKNSYLLIEDNKLMKSFVQNYTETYIHRSGKNKFQSLA